MLGLLLLYFIGKRFYELAGQFGKHKWFYTIFSIMVYYVVGIVLVAIIMLLDIMIFEWQFDWEASWGINYLSVPFGLMGVFIFYTLLKKKWEKSQFLVIDEIQDIGKSENGF